MYEILSHGSKTYIHTVKFRNKAKEVIFFKGRFGGLIFEGAYIWRVIFSFQNSYNNVAAHMCKTLPNIYKTQTST